MMIVRAVCDMEAGTEITFRYANPDAESAKPMDVKLRHWGFVCGCALCLEARAADAAVIRKRQKLTEGLKRVLNSSPISRFDVERIEHLLDALNQTYPKPAEVVPRLLLWYPQLALTRIHEAQNSFRKSLKSAVKVLTSLGFVVVGADSSQKPFDIVRWGVQVDPLVETFLHIRNAFRAMGFREDSERAKEFAKTVYEILVGENVSFQAHYD